MKRHSFLTLIFLSLMLPYCGRDSKDQYPRASGDFEINPVGNTTIEDSVTKKFIQDFINLPQNINRKVFTVFIDQQSDSLSLTIWRYPYRHIKTEDVIGYFRCDGRIILLYSPFSDLLVRKKDLNFEKEVNKLYQSELEYYRKYRHELVMWQLLYSYHQKDYKIITNYNHIVNTMKIAIPDSIIVDIQWPAD